MCYLLFITNILTFLLKKMFKDVSSTYALETFHLFSVLFAVFLYLVDAGGAVNCGSI